MEQTENRNEVNIDLDKYMSLVDKLDDAEDTITALKAEAEAAKKQLAPPKRKFMDLFLDDNDVNEKAIIGFISFFFMIVFLSISYIIYISNFFLSHFIRKLISFALLLLCR